ncbi:GNAT family N-acetyltransferase [Picosynechococcus sp. PCC 73109]|uniref:GNAT family N-acetyltransferase n=1 Tax=Picosynechococcus sp. PCC 73109 TaxID=374982 RepID=UPI0007458782|nr:GNAT family N-acetyltransferase [Picosynechococcus sp. PCC 73109]AMA10287.1 acetyltransferase [Picosynechococcus sp. PCC 73109]
MDQAWRDKFWVRDWQPGDRADAAKVIEQVLKEYGLPWEPEGADQELFNIDKYYWQQGGEFWVIEQAGTIVGTAAYYPIPKGNKAVEIRKMYLLPEVRGQGLGKYLLEELEKAIASRGFAEIWIETVTVLKEAVQLYESQGYQPITDVETARCDLAYIKYLP